MRGLLKTRSAGNQLLVVFCIIIASLFIVGLVGQYVVMSISGMSMEQLKDMDKWDFSKSSTIVAMRGLQVVNFIAFLLVPSLAAGWLFSTNTKAYLQLERPSNSGYWMAGVLIMIVALPLAQWLGVMNRNISFPPDMASWMKESEDRVARTMKGLLSHHTPLDLVANLFFIALFAGVGEELLFRGVIQRLLTRIFKSPWAAIIVTAALFSAVHLQFYGFFPRLLLGILLGAMFWYSGSLWVAIAAHFIYDALLVILAYYNPQLLESQEQPVSAQALALMGSVSFLLVVIFIEWMRRRSTATYAAVYGAEDEAVRKPFQRN